jgi:nucleotidyltransferase/DNA polymerase involved in DNA repair
MQTNITSYSEKYFWAFAIDKQPPAKRYIPSTKPKANLHRYLITACSKEAKAFGVRVGMTYAEAKRLVPNIRVLVYNR